MNLTDENKTLIKETTEKYFKTFVHVAVNGLIGE